MGKRYKSIKPKVALHKLDWLEWISVLFCLWLWFYPRPYQTIFTIVLLLPIIGLIMNGVSRPSLASLVSISNQGGDTKYDLADFIELPGLVILIRVLMDYEYESFFSIIKVGTVGFILLLILIITTHKLVEKSDKNKSLIYFSVIGNIALYSYAATYGINCVYDESPAKTYEARVIDKSISRGRRHKIYYLKVEPWGHHKDPEKISVTSDKYYETVVGTTVIIDYREGLLSIPWYYIEE